MVESSTTSVTTMASRMLDPASGYRSARLFRAVQVVAVVAGCGAVMAGTMAELDARHGRSLTLVLTALSLLFLAEYALRLVLAPGLADAARRGYAHPWAARFGFAGSPLGLVDLLAAATLPVLLASGMSGASARLVAVLWVFKLVRYTPALALLGRVIRNEGRALGGVMIGFLIALLLASTAAYLFERHDQPETFGSIPGAMWWAIVTLTTTGYGDQTPVTALGRALAGLVMIGGIACFALWAGILATGFAQEVRRQSFLDTWGLVARVPLFRNAGASTIAEVTRLLRRRDVQARQEIIRKGDPGDCMYFVAAGEVEIAVEPGPVRLGPGGFFGEMALVTGEPRMATVAALTSTTLLVLDVADFLGMASSHPDLLRAIEDEAARRRGVGPRGTPVAPG